MGVKQQWLETGGLHKISAEVKNEFSCTFTVTRALKACTTPGNVDRNKCCITVNNGIEMKVKELLAV